ncbi:hypothetical protein BV20DRAFT_976773 [Pilatotrama ljubarskyi]|nr:hypothetical protein BV20DRAFT_976773 [Pilatotrama ljubarskyi]
MASHLDNASGLQQESTWIPDAILRNKMESDDQLWEFNAWSMPNRAPAPVVHQSFLAQAIPTIEHRCMLVHPPHSTCGPRYVVVPQDLYGDPKSQEFFHDDVYFETPAGPGISLAHALHGQVDDLCRRDEPAFSRDAKVTSKISLRIQRRFQFQGMVPYHRQIMALRSTSTAEPIALGKMAQKIAEETRAYLKGETLSVGERTYCFEEIILWRLRRATKGSWQPEYWILV